MNELKIGIYGQILDGDLKSWYVFIQDDVENTGGYLILLSASLEHTDPTGFDDWVENFQKLQEYFRTKKWTIRWLDNICSTQ